MAYVMLCVLGFNTIIMILYYNYSRFLDNVAFEVREYFRTNVRCNNIEQCFSFPMNLGGDFFQNMLRKGSLVHGCRLVRDDNGYKMSVEDTANLFKRAIERTYGNDPYYKFRIESEVVSVKTNAKGDATFTNEHGKVFRMDSEQIIEICPTNVRYYNREFTI